jgi:thioredoxin:protein disulfide reductase
VTDAFEVVNDWVGRELASSTGAGVFLYLVLGGALASLLPCVYPLYPITAAVLRGRSATGSRFAHPLAYYAGLCATYVGFGVAASLAGGAFGGLLRLPAANLIIGSTLLVLALATIGLLHFPMLSVDEGGRSSLTATVAMGAGAGLLSSACVGPVVVSILVQLAAHTGALAPAAVAGAALKMGAFGMGVGSPLLLIGVLGVALPRGGKWMLYVQWAFGGLIAYFAVGYLGKGMKGLGLSAAAVQGVLLGSGMLVTSVYALQRSEVSQAERVKASLLALLGAVGFFVLGRAIVGPGSETASSPGRAESVAQGPAIEQAGGITWHLDKTAAYAAAAQTGRPVFVDFHAEWCSNCKAFQERAQRDERLQAAMRKAVLLKVYDDSPLFGVYRDDPRFPELRVGLPFFVITDAKGELLYKTSDFTKTDEMALFLSDT